MSCGIHNGCKIIIYVNQCMRNTVNTFNINNEIFIRRKLSSFKKVLRPAPLVKPYRSVEGVTIFYENCGSNVLRKHQVVPVACNLYCNDSKPQVEEKKEKQSIYKRFKTMFKKYWYVLVPVHILTSCFWFGSFYYMAASGVDICAVLESLGAPESWIEKFKNTKAGNMVVAYTLYKIATPLRYTVTVGGTTISINYLQKMGWIKPAPSSEQIKKIYQGQKDAFKDLKAGYQDKMQVTKNEFLKTKDEMKKQFEVAKEEFHKSMSEMRSELKGGVKDGAEEWKMISKSVVREVKEGIESFKKK